MVPIYYRCRVLRRGIVDTYRAFGFWDLFGGAIILAVGWPAQYFIVNRFPDAKMWLGDPASQWWNGLLYAVGAIGAIALIVCAFNVFMAPSRMDAEKEKQIAELKMQLAEDVDRPSLVVAFDKKDESCFQESDIAVMARVRISLSPDTGGTKHLKVILKHIQPTKNKRAMKKSLAVFQGACLMEKHDDCEPVKRDFSLNPGESLYFDVIKQITDPNHQHWAAGKLFLCHAIGVRLKESSDTQRSVLGNNRYVRHPKDEIPHVGYNLTIKVTAERGTPRTANLRLGRTSKGGISLRLIS